MRLHQESSLPLYQQCGLKTLLADIGGWWRKTEIDNWRQRQRGRERERGCLDFERISRISMLCLPEVNTFEEEEEAKERKRNTLCLLISELIEATLVSRHCTQRR